ncbi:MAG TPA: hypothetical protein VMJ35_07000 [Dongiaceae bacterium]|nr:hypothetical protein [Dongiaceae bacterium]
MKASWSELGSAEQQWTVSAPSNEFSRVHRHNYKVNKNAVARFEE